jgi:hypothetical protein
MSKGRSSSECRSSLPSLRTYLRPRDGAGKTRFAEEGAVGREDSPSARSIARFAASFGIDTRLGICCFGLCPQTSSVTLDLDKLRMAVTACCPEKQARFNQDCKRFLNERCLGLQTVEMTLQDLTNIRSCAELYYGNPVQQDVAEGIGPPFQATRKTKDIFHTLKLQRQKGAEEVAGDTPQSWAETLLRDGRDANRTVPLVVSEIVGVHMERPLSCHVRFGLRPTSQFLRTRAEYEEDSAQVGTAVEEMEFLVGDASVPRPPPLFLVPMQIDQSGDARPN